MRVAFIPQARDGYCLPACAQMALAYHGIAIAQETLISLLDATDEGAPFSRITRIEKYGVQVVLQRNANLEAIITAMNAHAPSIVAVNLLFCLTQWRTTIMPYWLRMPTPLKFRCLTQQQRAVHTQFLLMHFLRHGLNVIVHWL